MSLRLRALVLSLVCFTAFAQPGLPPCWLMSPACSQHIHINQAHTGASHSHDYLFELSQATGSQVLPVWLVPVSILLTMIFGASIWRRIGSQHPGGNRWKDLPDPPPPRPISSLA